MEWNITVNGKTYKNVKGLRFVPKIRYKRGGEMPITVTVTAAVDGEAIGSSSGTITSPGQTITLPPIEWYPSAEGTFTITFTAEASDPAGRKGTAHASLTAVVEAVVGPPEIEIIIETG